MTTLDEINTVDQVADYLHIPPAKVTRLKGEGKIGYLKMGKSVMYPRAAVEAFVVANTVEALPANPHGLTDSSLRRVRRGA